MMFLFLGSICLGSAFAVTDEDLRNGSQVYYTLDDDFITGTTIIDSVGNFNGTNNGATCGVTGIINESCNVSGNTAKYVEIPSTFGDDLGNTNVFSFSLWYKGDGTPWSNEGLLELGYIEDNSGEIILRAGSSDGSIKFRYDNNNLVQDNIITGVNDGNWHFIAITADGSNVVVYGDGVVVQNFSNSAVLDFGGKESVLGTYYRKNDGSLNFKGYLDEFYFNNETLNSNEIQELYNRQVNNQTGAQYDFTSYSLPTIEANVQDFYSSIDISFNLTTNPVENTNMSMFLDNLNETSICNNCSNATLELTNLTEGAHSILFVSANSDGQTNSTYNFTIDITPPVINVFNTSERNSYTVNWTKVFNYSDATYCEVRVENTTSGCNTTYEFSENGNQSVEVFVNDSAGNHAQENFTLFLNPIQKFYFYDDVRSLDIENYTFGGYNSTNGTIEIPVYDLGLGNHSLEFKKDGYVAEDFEFSFNTTSRINQTFNATPVTLTIKVYDENSPSTQLEVNISINNGTNYTQYKGQTDFEKYYNETVPGNLTITIEKAGYGTRKIFTELTPFSTVSHEVYLLDEELTTPVIFRTQNLAQTQAIEDVVFTFKKEIDGEPTFLGQAKTDSQGYTYFNMDVLDDYEITISKNGYVTQVISSIPGKTDYTILMEESTTGSTFLYDDFSYRILPIKDTVKSVPFNVSAIVYDEDNLVSSMRLTVTGDNTSFTDVLTNSNGGTIDYTIENKSARYLLNLTVMREGEEYNFIKKITYVPSTSKNSSISNVSSELDGESNNAARVFVILIAYVSAIVLGSLFSPAIGSVFGLVPITIFAIPAVGWLTPGVAAVFYILTILGGLYFER